MIRIEKKDLEEQQIKLTDIIDAWYKLAKNHTDHKVH
jgi:hypothetical protein